MIDMKIILEDKVYTIDFKKILEKKGYKYFTEGSYNLNIIGIRRDTPKVTNKFDDVLVVLYNTPTHRNSRKVYTITTDPGLSHMKKPTNKKGTAILVPGQYRGAYKIGYHKGRYKALCQNKPVKVYRDNNKDDVYDFEPETIDEGVFGINIHKAGLSSTIVNDWSAGCQVFADSKDFKHFMVLCDKQVEAGLGNSFTYTLLEEKDVV